MRFGLAAWGLREEPLEAQLRITRELGLDLLEFSIANYAKDALQIPCADAEIANVKALFQRYGVRLECGCTGDDLTNDDVEEQKRKVAAVIEVSARLGLKYLRVFAGFNSDSRVHGERLTRMLGALRELNALASGKGVTLCVETHGGVAALADGALLHFHSVSTRVDQLRKILDAGASLCYDPANLSAVGCAAPEAFYRLFRDRIPYVHLKDFKDVPGGVVPAACGEGRLDWDALMGALQDYDGPAMIEYELPGDVKDGMARSLDFLRRFATREP